MTFKKIWFLDDDSALNRPGWRVMFVGVFTMVLLITIVAQILGLDWRSWFSVSEGKPLLGCAKCAAYNLMAQIN